MQELISKRRDQHRIQIRNISLQTAFQHNRKHILQEAQQHSLANQVQQQLLSLNKTLLSSGLSQDLLAQLLNLSFGGGNMNLWIQTGVVKSLLILLQTKGISIAQTSSLLRVIDRLVAKTQHTKDVEYLMQLKIVPLLLQLAVFRQISEPTLHLISNICGDSYAFRDQFIQEGLVEIIPQILEFAKLDKELCKTVAWAISNIARTQNQDWPVPLNDNQIRFLTVSSLSLMTCTQGDIIKNATYTLKFLSNVRLAIDTMFSCYSFTTLLISKIQQRKQYSLIVMQLVGRLINADSQYAQLLLAEGLLSCFAMILNQNMFFEREYQLIGWIIASLCQRDQNCLQLVLYSMIILKFKEVVDAHSNQKIKRQFHFILINSLRTATAQQIHALINIRWYLTDFASILTSDNPPALIHAALLALRKALTQVGRLQQNSLWLQMRQDLTVTQCVQSLCQHENREVSMTAQQIIEQFFKII